jgi:alkylation response protein AidB-like acyl-CoA dehydrogenase
VFAHVRRPGAERTLTAFLVPLDSPGLEVFTLEHTGLRGVSFGGLRLSGVPVPRAMRVGGEGEGFQLFVRHFTYWRTMMAAAAIGCGRGALDQAVTWLRERQAFGGPIGRFTHLQQELAQHVARLHMAWLLVQSSAARQDARQPAFADACMAKAEGIEAALAATDFAQRVHGARAQTTLFDLEKRQRDLQALRIAGGPPDVLRSQVARAVLGNPLYEAALGREQTSAGDDPQLGSRRFW